MEEEQRVLESTKFTEEVVIPGYKDILTRAWNRLLWEPTVDYDPENPLTETMIEAPTKHHEYNGFHVVTIDAEAVMRGRLFKATEDPERFILSNPGPRSKVPLSEFVEKAPRAERVLDDLRDKQEDELRVDTKGKQILWKPDQDLLGVTRAKVIGISNKPITVFVRQGELYCPTHTDEKLAGDAFHGLEGLTCPTRPGHFWVFIK